MEHQQKQLLHLVGASAYSGNPLYATLITTMLGYSQAAADSSALTSIQQQSNRDELGDGSIRITGNSTFLQCDEEYLRPKADCLELFHQSRIFYHQHSAL
ncbi:hypothetical protein [Echinococcus multilocularis]|uniref:Uncharacterized protein n=1 Tax=Echinococcus multilocularis TaxID=6211 RepID=A0A068Y2T1_ECHMU|nr:hypothetical protein [Echinococcus multilocularis]